MSIRELVRRGYRRPVIVVVAVVGLLAVVADAVGLFQMLWWLVRHIVVAVAIFFRNLFHPQLIYVVLFLQRDQLLRELREAPLCIVLH